MILNFKIYSIFLLICLTFIFCKPVKQVSPTEYSTEYWINQGKNNLLKSLSKKDNKNKAKNIIIFIGDGMGISTLTAARIIKNQIKIDSIQPDEELFMESLMNSGLIETYNIKDYVTESSSSASAILNGIKINPRTINISPNISMKNCKDYNPIRDNIPLVSEIFYKAGKSLGLVTTARITHATPAAVYSHSLSRYYEYRVPKKCRKQKDIASQFIQKSRYFNVALGGGIKNFLPKKLGGFRKDKRNLITEWRKSLSEFNASVVTNGSDFRRINNEETEYLLGLFSESHLKYDENAGNDPSIEEMTKMAVKILSKNDKGYFLIVESARIDHAHHKGLAQKAISETLKLDDTIKMVYNMINMEESLIIVTADHSHVFTIGSYAHRNEDITGMNQAHYGKELDHKGHTTLFYANGPGYLSPRLNITSNMKFTSNYVYPSGVPMKKETHGGEEVAIYAEGPWSHLFNGLHQNTFIRHVILYASCLYDKEGVPSMHCVEDNSTKNNTIEHNFNNTKGFGL